MFNWFKKRKRRKRAKAGLLFMVREAKEGFFNVEDFEDLVKKL